MERDCESELSKLNIEQNACIYHFGASVIHGQRSNILRLPYLMLYKGKLDQIIMCLYVEVICKIQTMYVTNLRSGLEYIVKEQNDLAKDYYKKIAQPVRV